MKFCEYSPNNLKIEHGLVLESFLHLLICHCDNQRSDTQHNDTQHNDTQHNDTQHNDTQHNDTEYNDTQHNDTEYNDAQHNALVCVTQHKRHSERRKKTLSIITPIIIEYRYAEPCTLITVILSAIKLSVVMLNVGMLSFMDLLILT
jgi:hypothetical protein